MREIWDSVRDEERFERKLKRLENMTPDQKRKHLASINAAEQRKYRQHMEMNKIIDKERMMGDVGVDDDEIGAFYPQ